MSYLLLFLLAVVVPAAAQAQEQQKTGRTIALYGHVKNSVTGVGVKDAFVTLMREDSTVVDTMHVEKQWSDGGKEDYYYRFKVPAQETKFIIRAEHQDFETCDVNYHMRHIARNTYFDAPYHYMKKKPAERQMRELTVRATKVKMYYKGDTITFNADAFNLPEGSMLDALIRQMDGVELKDDGRILVQGEQVDELMLNGKDFFKGNNRVMLDNLPAYTVKQVQTYHKSTEKSEYLGRNYDKKRFVMDVHLKREYNQGWMANAGVAGGTPFCRDIDLPYIARFFALRYTDNTRFSLFGNMNNVNETRKPGGDGEWNPSRIPIGVNETRHAGAEFMIEERDKRWKETVQADVRWQRTKNDYTFNNEQFHTDAPNTYNRSITRQRNRNLSVNASNEFTLRKPFFIYSNTHFSYRDFNDNSSSSSAQFNADPALASDSPESLTTTALLDSVFTSTLSTEMQQILVNSRLHQQNSKGNSTNISTNNYFSYKLPSGDNADISMGFSHDRQHNETESEQQLNYRLTPTLNNILNRHGSTPSKETGFNIAPEYRITWPCGIWLNTEYRFLYRQRDNTNDVYLADTLDLQNAYDRMHRRVENRLAITPGYTFEKDGRYAQIYYQMHFYNVNERLNYSSAYTDTSLVQHCWTMSPELHMNFGWDNWARSFDLFYGIEFQTPDLFQKVNILNNENPLVRRYGNPDLRGATNHRMQFGVNRNWRDKRISERIGGGLRFFRHQVSQGQSYDPSTGIYTYRPENVEGNWQTYFFNFFSMPLDRPRRLMINIYTHGDYTRNVDVAATTTPSGSVGTSSSVSDGLPVGTLSLTHVNNYYIENRLTLSYTIGDLTLSLPTYIEYRHTTNQEGTIKPINATGFNYGLTLNYSVKRDDSSKSPRWLQGFGIATDIKMYSRRGYDDASMNTNELVWNASISRSFPNPFGKRAGGSLVARLEGFDILNRLSTAHLIINGQGRQETIYNTLPRYLMLHLTYNFSRSPKKK